VVRRQELAEVAQALERLRPDDQEILRLQVWEELPRTAIGKVLGISENAVDQRVSRATKRLTTQVKQAPNPAPARRMTRKGGTA
jgi:RNA polymerase sigma factor (sigma-70 family)